jgi:UDP-GlcNAc3NAcA epimerase
MVHSVIGKVKDTKINNNLKILSIVGARPQFIKAALISRELRKNFKEILVHTGQHFDHEMSEIFFKELNIPKPEYNLGIHGHSNSEQIGLMMIELEKVLNKEKPNLVLVYGDTDSTLAGALTASKLKIPIAHVEAGMRSFDRSMPEEINRIVTDHISSILFCPNINAINLLKKEGIKKNVHDLGDVMYDLMNECLKNEKMKIQKLSKLKLSPKGYLLATVHRAGNTDNEIKLKTIFEALSESNETIVIPIHPRTKKAIATYGITLGNNIKIIEPVNYYEMLFLEKNAKKILTDSGGIQKEAYWLGIPCITLRENTEWTETVEDNWNILVGSDKLQILNSIKNFTPVHNRSFLPKKNSHLRISKIIMDFFDNKNY